MYRLCKQVIDPKTLPTLDGYDRARAYRTRAQQIKDSRRLPARDCRGPSTTKGRTGAMPRQSRQRKPQPGQSRLGQWGNNCDTQGGREEAPNQRTEPPAPLSSWPSGGAIQSTRAQRSRGGGGNTPQRFENKTQLEPIELDPLNYNMNAKNCCNNKCLHLGCLLPMTVCLLDCRRRSFYVLGSSQQLLLFLIFSPQHTLFKLLQLGYL